MFGDKFLSNILLNCVTSDNLRIDDYLNIPEEEEEELFPQISLCLPLSMKSRSIGKPFKLVSSNLSQSKPKGLFSVVRKVSFTPSFLSRLLSSDDTFMLAGELTVDRKLFSRIKSGNRKEPFGPISTFRPQTVIERFSQNYIICFLSQVYNGIRNVAPSQLMLSQLNVEETQYLQQYLPIHQKIIDQSDIIRAKINKEIFLQQRIIENNHQESLEKAKSIMALAQQDKVYVFIYLRFDSETCTHKLFFIGGNSKLSEAFLGTPDLNIFSAYCARYSFPLFNNADGVLNVQATRFTGISTFQSGLGTFDDELLPYEATRTFVKLKETDIGDGVMVGDKFEMRELKFDQTLLQGVQNKREKGGTYHKELLKVDDLGYSLNAEAFVQKFYPTKQELSNFSDQVKQIQ